VVVMGGYSLAMEEIMVVRGGYLLPRVDLHAESSQKWLLLGRGRRL
jgi:hypothetical protein